MVNRVIRLLVLSDFLLFFSIGLLAPIFAVFILKSIDGSSLRVIGIGGACYWIARTLSTVPLSKLMDRTDGERDGSSDLESFYLLGIFYCVDNDWLCTTLRTTTPKPGSAEPLRYGTRRELPIEKDCDAGTC